MKAAFLIIILSLAFLNACNERAKEGSSTVAVPKDSAELTGWAIIRNEESKKVLFTKKSLNKVRRSHGKDSEITIMVRCESTEDPSVIVSTASALKDVSGDHYFAPVRVQFGADQPVVYRWLASEDSLSPMRGTPFIDKLRRHRQVSVEYSALRVGKQTAIFDGTGLADLMDKEFLCRDRSSPTNSVR